MKKYARPILVLGLAILLVGCGPIGSNSVRRGEVAPEFTLETLSGEKVSLSDFKGRPVLVNFWATWCPPCRSEMPELQRTYVAQAHIGLVILAVNRLYDEETETDVREFVREQGLTFPILLEREESVTKVYRVSFLPTSVFITPEGKIHLIQVGPMTQKFIESVLQEMH